MHILFDHQTFSIQTYGGISRYFGRLIKGINATNDNQATLAVRWSDNGYIDKPAPLTNVRFKGRGRLLYTVNQQYSRQAICRNNFDLLHTTYYDPYFLANIGQRPFVITIHDMIHERLGSQFAELQPDHYAVGKRILAQRATAIIAVSEFTRQDVISLLGVDPARVHVVHHANPLSIQTDKCPVTDRRPYLLFVGNREHYKNFSGLLTTFALLSDYPELDLICAGGGAFTIVEQQQIESLNLTFRVKHQAFRTDSVLVSLYTSALAFVFPSLYEGFGIPILEAFSCGCPCILSQTSSLPEVAQDAAIYMDPTNPHDMAQSIGSLLNNQVLRTSLIKKGYEQLSKFSWESTVSKTIAVYEHAV